MKKFSLLLLFAFTSICSFAQLKGSVKNLVVKNGQKTPLIVIDGAKQPKGDKTQIDKLNTKSIKMVNVLSDHEAIAKYGKAGKNGVVEITTRKTTNTPVKGSIKKTTKSSNAVITENKNYLSTTKSPPLYIVDGAEVANIEQIKPDQIKSMEVKSAVQAVKIYGDKGKNGVVTIKTKTEISKNK